MVVSFGAANIIYSHCFLLMGLLKLHYLPRLYRPLSKSFFPYVTIFAGTLRILASTLKFLDYDAIPILSNHASVVRCRSCYPQ